MKKIETGLYSLYSFNDGDANLRSVGLYAEQFVSKEELLLVLEQLSKDVEGLERFALIPAAEVIIPRSQESDLRDNYVLYMPMERISPLYKKFNQTS